MMIGAGLDARLGLPFGQLRDVAREARRLGFESLWTPAGTVPDAFHVCAAWSGDTGLRTGISVVPAVRMWDPLSLALQAATVAQLSDGRFVTGLGTGGYGPGFWLSAGLPDKPIAVMREYVGIVRELLRGETVTSDGPVGRGRRLSLGARDLPSAPVYLAALGPQMLALAGETADGALLNWATPERIAASREQIARGCSRAGRDPGEVTVTMYVRVCIDDDVTAARRAFGTQVLGYAMGQPGVPDTAGYRGLFGQMGFDAALTELETRRDQGAKLPELVDAAPDELLQAVGYYGPAAGAPEAFARLSAGLDETIVRVITARPGPGPVVEAMTALTPAAIRAAAGE
jgi:alkanesulfonate monooxygenase SsuD/methylene tetrahydromethanopterin reductase-like flavin-dependent oxidoreductase (luciferase family)